MATQAAKMSKEETQGGATTGLSQRVSGDDQGHARISCTNCAWRCTRSPGQAAMT